MTNYNGDYDLERLRRAGRARAAAEAKREQAMAALVEEICAADVAGVPREQIARLAGVSKPTVYAALNG